MNSWIGEMLASFPPLMTAAEVEKVLRISPRTLRRMIEDGQIAGMRTGSGSGSARLMIPRAEVARYLQTKIAPVEATERLPNL